VLPTNIFESWLSFVWPQMMAMSDGSKGASDHAGYLSFSQGSRDIWRSSNHPQRGHANKKYGRKFLIKFRDANERYYVKLDTKSIAREQMSQRFRDSLKDCYQSSLVHKQRKRLLEKNL